MQTLTATSCWAGSAAGPRSWPWRRVPRNTVGSARADMQGTAVTVTVSWSVRQLWLCIRMSDDSGADPEPLWTTTWVVGVVGWCANTGEQTAQRPWSAMSCHRRCVCAVCCRCRDVQCMLCACSITACGHALAPSSPRSRLAFRVCLYPPLCCAAVNAACHCLAAQGTTLSCCCSLSPRCPPSRTQLQPRLLDCCRPLLFSWSSGKRGSGGRIPEINASPLISCTIVDGQV